MKRGFIFTTEALICLIIVISTLAIIGYTTLNPEMSREYVNLEQQSKKATAFYFNESASAVIVTNNAYCSSIAYYDAAAKNILGKEICRGYP